MNSVRLILYRQQRLISAEELIECNSLCECFHIEYGVCVPIIYDYSRDDGGAVGYCRLSVAVWVREASERERLGKCRRSKKGMRRIITGSKQASERAKRTNGRERLDASRLMRNSGGNDGGKNKQRK